MEQFYANEKRIICIRNDTKRPKTIAKKTTSKSVYEEILMFRLVNMEEKYKYWQENKIQTKYA